MVAGQTRIDNPLVAVVVITVGALAAVCALVALATRSAPHTSSTAEHGPAPGRTSPQRTPATSSALPPKTGHGHRVVYALGAGRVWMVASDDDVRRTYLVRRAHTAATLSVGRYRVSAKRLNQELDGSSHRLRYIVRMRKGTGGTSGLGFCTVPLTRSGVPLRSSNEAGSEAAEVECIQQRVSDARNLYGWVSVDTPVVVIP